MSRLPLILALSSLILLTWQGMSEEAELLMAELEEIKVPAKTVWEAEKFFLELYKRQSKGQPMPNDHRAKLRRNIAEKQIEMGLIQKFVRENNLQIDPAYAEERFTLMKQSLQDQGVSLPMHFARFGKSELEFKSFNSALLALELKLAAQIGDEELKASWAQEERYLHTRRGRHILVQFEGARMNRSKRTKEEALRRAQEALQKLQDGEAFDTIARDYSDAPSPQGAAIGELGYLAEAHVIDPQTGRPLRDKHSGQPVNHVIEPPLTKALFALEKPGQLSEIVESDFGYHILMLTERKTFEEFKDFLRQQLLGVKMSKFIQQLKQDHESKLRLNEKLIDQPPPGESNDTPVSSPSPAAAE